MTLDNTNTHIMTGNCYYENDTDNILLLRIIYDCLSNDRFDTITEGYRNPKLHTLTEPGYISSEEL